MRDPIWFAAFERGIANGLTDTQAVDNASQQLKRLVEEKKDEEDETI